jgi:DNA-directed RNA polymerase specialized sigma24 family protein
VVAQNDLRRVQRVRARLEKARVELRDAILQAQRSGESIRDIAAAAGLSPTRVHELLREAPQS